MGNASSRGHDRYLGFELLHRRGSHHDVLQSLTDRLDQTGLQLWILDTQYHRDMIYLSGRVHGVSQSHTLNAFSKLRPMYLRRIIPGHPTCRDLRLAWSKKTKQWRCRGCGKFIKQL